MELNGRWVRFAIQDIYFPGPDVVLPQWQGDDLLCGQIVELSDSGADRSAYAVVQVNGLDCRVVVAVERIREYIDRPVPPPGDAHGG